MIRIKTIFIFLYFFIVLLTCGLVFFLSQQDQKFLPTQEGNRSYDFLQGKIIEEIPISSSENGEKHFRVVVYPNRGEGKEIVATVNNFIDFNKYKQGNTVQIYESLDQEGNAQYEIADYWHQSGLLWIFAFFVIITILIAKKKGAMAIISVLLSLVLFYFLFLRMIFVGISPLVACFTFVSLITVLTIPPIHGFTKKSLSALISVFLAYILSLGIVFLFQKIVVLGITPGEDFRNLIVQYPTIGLSEILLASLFMSAVGAIIDTSVSIASAVFEALQEKSKIIFREVYEIGMAVGKDILGSMINTLLFAYLSGAIPFLILVSLGQGSSLTTFINMDFISLELTRTFIGALSLVFLLPITAAISAYFFLQKNPKD
jgi:uncharacterized membrane protein